MRIETDMLVMKDGMDWGMKYVAHYDNDYGWTAIEEAIEKTSIYNSELCKQPADITYQISPHVELLTAEIVPVQIQTEVIIKVEPEKFIVSNI